ncbi:peptide deformylase [Candidatus Saccharibacteria bacterium]|nr:peptide deformylase [Candidatus Saccharibacteria bacterium]
MATKDAIITLPHPHLRERSRKVKSISDGIRQLVADMEAATLDWEASRKHELGVALAAVQIDRLERVVVVRNDFDNKDDRTFLALINPEVIQTSGKPELDHEGCLSVRDVYGLVPRYPAIKVKALSLDGQEIRVKAEGFLARVLQHEIDHTNGILFVDHVRGQDGFFHLDKNGHLEPVPLETVKQSGILSEE